MPRATRIGLPGGALTLLEQYNGLGYANRGLPSPYIWSGTDRYLKGCAPSGRIRGNGAGRYPIALHWRCYRRYRPSPDQDAQMTELMELAPWAASSRQAG
jgi:hypothetical protein